MVDMVCDALARRGIQDEILAAALFHEQGNGRLIGGDLAERVNGLAGDLGASAHERMLVAVSTRTVYGLDPQRDPPELVFQLARAQLDVRVQRRFTAHVVELVDRVSGRRYAFNGGRLPHGRGVIAELRLPGRNGRPDPGRSAA
jgi:hypothetical protein